MGGLQIGLYHVNTHFREIGIDEVANRIVKRGRSLAKQPI